LLYFLVLAAPVLALMLLKLLRTLQELRSRRAGFITFGGDDRYQARNLTRDVHDAVMIARIRLQMPREAFQQIVERVERNYPRWFEQLRDSIRHRPASFESALEIRDRYTDYQLSGTPILARILFFPGEQIIVLVGNHVYLGGYLLSQFVQLVFCAQISKQVFPRNRYFPVLSELMILALFARLLLRPKRIGPPLHADKSLIQRFYLKQDLAKLREKAASLGMQPMYLVIAQHIHLVMRRMNRETLRVTLPVSFEDEHSFNTVGAVFLDVDREPDLGAMAHKVHRAVVRARWQVSASNQVQRIFPTRKLSERARNMVDLTLTVVPQKTLPGNLLAGEMKDYEFTMDSIQYPVYAMAFIFEEQVHTSFMINTPQFDVEGLLAEDEAVRSDLSVHHRHGE
jgi:hypothetical protein